MKSTRVRTLRGTIDLGALSQGRRQLIIDDGLINIGYKVLSWSIWPYNNNGADRWSGILSTKPEVFPINMDAANNNQIGWNFKYDNPSTTDIISVLDPDHVAVRDLYIALEAGGAAPNELMNYLIVMQQYDLTDDEAIIQISKEENQASSPV